MYRNEEKTLGVSIIYQKSKTNIPKAVRKLLNIKNGDRLIWTWKNGVLVVHHESN